MIFNPSKKSQRALASHDFIVSIDRLLGPGETQSLVMGVDAVKGLSDAKTNVIYHRANGLESTVLTPFPGLSKAENITLEGIYLADMADLKALQDWHDEVKGKKLVSLGDYKRIITIKHLARDLDGNDLLKDNKEISVKRKFVVKDAFITKLSVGDLDANSPNFATWSIEIAFSDMEIQG